MRVLTLTSLVALGAAFATPAAAQDVPERRFEPYVGVTGAYESFDSEPSVAGIPNRNGIDSWEVEGVAGVNVPLGNRLFVGAEGHVSKGFRDVDWQYGVAGRAGVRTDNGGLIYGKAGYRWVNFHNHVTPAGGDKGNWTFGGGVELPVGGDASRFRIRAEANTYGDFHSVRPAVGVVMGF